MSSQQVQARRRRILTTARVVFVEHGFHGASMDEIATAAKVSKPTVYKYFGSKQGLFAAIVEDAAQEILTPLHGIPLPTRTDLAETLRDLGRTYARVLLSAPMLAFHRLALSEAARFPELGRSYYQAGPRAAEEGIGTYLAKLAADGQLDIPDAELAAQHFWALILGPPRQILLFGARPLSQHEVNQYVDAGLDVFLAHYRRSVTGS